MQSIRPSIWGAAFTLAFAFLLIAGTVAGKLVNIIPIIMVLLDIVLLFIATFILLVAAWLFPRFRSLFIHINLSFVLVLILYFSCFIVWSSRTFENAKTYVAVADPVLEEYYQKHGHYPDSLSQLGLEMKPPSGLTYHRVYDPTRKWPVISSWPIRDTKDEMYSFNYYGAVYEGNGYWFIDD
jgi:Ca2+/Na+ antiporter